MKKAIESYERIINETLSTTVTDSPEDLDEVTTISPISNHTDLPLNETTTLKKLTKIPDADFRSLDSGALAKETSLTALLLPLFLVLSLLS